MAGLTGWQALFDHAHLSSKDTILIHGAAGGVGSFAVQLADMCSMGWSTYHWNSFSTQFQVSYNEVQSELTFGGYYARSNQIISSNRPCV